MAGWAPYGTQASNSNTQYAWAGDPYNSKAIALKRQNWSFIGRHAMLDAGTLFNPAAGVEVAARGLSEPTALYLADIIPNQAALDDGVYLYGEFVTPNLAFTAPTIRAVLDCYDASNALLATFTGTGIVPNILVTGTEAVTAANLLVPALPAGTAVLRGRFEFVTPLFGQIVYASHFMLVDRNANVGFVAGSSTGTPGVHTYSWGGTANASVSV